MLLGIHIYFYLLFILVNISVNFLNSFCREIRQGPLLKGRFLLKITYFLVALILLLSITEIKWYFPLIIIAIFLLTTPIGFTFNKIVYRHFRISNALWIVIFLDIFSLFLIFRYIIFIV
jgi:hypothetical protein